MAHASPAQITPGTVVRYRHWIKGTPLELSLCSDMFIVLSLAVPPVPYRSVVSLGCLVHSLGSSSCSSLGWTVCPLQRSLEGISSPAIDSMAKVTERMQGADEIKERPFKNALLNSAWSENRRKMISGRSNLPLDDRNCQSRAQYIEDGKMIGRHPKSVVPPFC
jgi:hypothetical protein